MIPSCSAIRVNSQLLPTIQQLYILILSPPQYYLTPPLMRFLKGFIMHLETKERHEENKQKKWKKTQYISHAWNPN